MQNLLDEDKPLITGKNVLVISTGFWSTLILQFGGGPTLIFREEDYSDNRFEQID